MMHGAIRVICSLKVLKDKRQIRILKGMIGYKSACVCACVCVKEIEINLKIDTMHSDSSEFMHEAD